MQSKLKATRTTTTHALMRIKKLKSNQELKMITNRE